MLKIDQAFVGGLGRDASDTAIVRSVIDLAHALGQAVVAEGVETAARPTISAGWAATSPRATTSPGPFPRTSSTRCSNAAPAGVTRG